MVDPVQVRGLGGKVSHGQNGGIPVGHVQPEVTGQALGQVGGGVDHGWGPGAALPQSVLDPPQRVVTGAVAGVMTRRPASIGAAIVREPEDDRVVIQTRVLRSRYQLKQNHIFHAP